MGFQREHTHIHIYIYIHNINRTNPDTRGYLRPRQDPAFRILTFGAKPLPMCTPVRIQSLPSHILFRLVTVRTGPEINKSMDTHMCGRRTGVGSMNTRALRNHFHIVHASPACTWHCFSGCDHCSSAAEKAKEKHGLSETLHVWTSRVLRAKITSGLSVKSCRGPSKSCTSFDS